MKQYDAVVVGSGTAGQTAAYALDEAGLSAAVVEKSERPGGTCALHGCQPKKWYYEAAELAARTRHLQGKGVVAPPALSWGDVRAQKEAFTSRIPENTVTNLKASGIDFIQGEARFLDGQTLEAGGEKISAGAFVLASGAKPMPLPFEGADLLSTSNDFLDLPSLPKSVVFVGGGFISLEFAHFAARLGPEGVRVTILEAGPRPLGPFDADMVNLLMEASREEGVDIHVNVNITSVTREDGGYKVSTSNAGDFFADLVVHGAGRAPDIEGLNLDAAGVERDRRGIVVDSSMQTSNPRVFAVGDCANTLQLARVADYEAQAAAQNIAARKNGGPSTFLDYSAAPALLFTYPQCGMVGRTESALKVQGVKYYKSFGKNLGWPTYRRVGLKHAAYKILADSEGRILGAHILSDNASGLINLFQWAMIHQVPADALRRQSIMTPYPSRESDVIYMLAPLQAD